MRKAVVAGLVVIALAFGTGQASGAACLGDVRIDFSDGTLGPWLVSGNDSVAAGSSARVVDGVLVLHRPAGIHGHGSSWVVLAGAYEICGDFDIRVDFDATRVAPPAGENGHHVSVGVREKGDGDFVGVERFYRAAPYGCVPYANSYKTWRNAGTDCAASFIPTERTQGRFRISRQGTQWTTWYWDDGRWAAARTFQAGSRAVEVALYTGGASPDSQEVRFDNLQIRSDRAHPPADSVRPAHEDLPVAQRALNGGRADEAFGIVAEFLFTMSHTDPDTSLVDQAHDLMVAAGARRAAGLHNGAGRRRPTTRPDTVGAIRRIEEHAFGLMGVIRQRVAVRLLERSLALRASMGLPDELWTAEALHSLGDVSWTLGDYRRSLAAYQRAHPIYQAFEGPHGRAHSIESNMAQQNLSLGELGEARRIWEALVTEFETHHLDRANHLAIFHMLLGEAYMLLGEDPRLAGTAFRRCIEVHTAAGLPKGGLGDAFMSLAGTYTAVGDPGRALAILDSLDDARVVRGDRSNIGWIQLHRAEALRATGRLDEASVMAGKARDLLETTWGFDHIGLRDAYQSLAKIRIAQRDWPQALAAAESAVAIARRWLPDPHPDQARSLMLLAQASAGSGRGAIAFDMAVEAERRLREALRILASDLSEGAAFRIDRDRAHALGVAHEALPAGSAAQVRTLLDAVVRSRGLILDLRVARLPATGGDSAGRALREDFAPACTRLSNLAMRPRESSRTAEDRSEIDDALAVRRRAELALAAHSASFSRQQVRGAAGLDDVLQALPAGAALVSFVRLGSARSDAVSLQPPASAGRYAALVVPPGGGDAVHVSLGDADRLDRLIESWRVAVAGRAASAQAGADLRRAIWDPLVAHLAGASSVVVVPDGALQLVNLGTLPVGGGRFLVETAPPIVTLGTERDLVRPRNAVVGSGLFALGGVDYQRASAIPVEEPAAATERRRDTYRSARASCGNFTQLRLDPLPASSAEVAEVASIWRAAAPDSSVRLLTGPGASEDRLKALAPAHRFLHLATHGFFLGPECDSTESAGGALRESPMLRSGLALSGFNARGQAAPDDEDGVLTAEEVAALDLGGVDCVVLSACESGLGVPTAGEGVLGLRRAFQLAGARTLVTSLWPVEDHAARAWMRSFHGHYAAGRSPGEAATNASRALLAELRRHGRPTSPADWGAFLVVGN